LHICGLINLLFMQKIKFSEILPHLIAIALFFLVTVFFFSPIFFENKSLTQHDIQQFQGGSKTLSDYREATGEEGLWASNMFSGMPAYLVSLRWSDGPVVWTKKVVGALLPHPVNAIFIAFLCYYIMLLSFGVRPYLAIAGALAFGLSSYLIIGLSAGHNARIGAIAFVPLVIAGIHLAFSGKRILGFGITAMALALHLRENHLQITYYLVLIVGTYGMVQLIYAIRAKRLAEFLKTFAVLVPAAIIAAGTFFGQLWAIQEYTRYSIRGASELAKPNSKKDVRGLSKEYAFAYKYGVIESMVLLIPDFYGGASSNSLVQDQESKTYKALVNSGDNEMANKLAQYSSSYWGPQDYCGGSYYAGAIVVFLFVVGILFADKKYVWWLVPISALSLMLSWGDSFSLFNYFMFDYFPGYNKFRSVNFALVMILFAMPLLGMIGLESLMAKGISKEAKKKLLLAFIFTGGLCLALVIFAGLGSFLKEGEGQLPVWFTKALASDRTSLLRADAFRSFAFILSIFIMLYFNVGKKISELGFYAFLIFMITMDIVIVDRRYFSKENFQRKRDTSFHANTAADEEILKDKSYYRVYNLQGAMAEARTSYNHHSLGGYHGAKLRRYQDLYDSCIAKETQRLYADAQAGQIDFKKYGVLNMLNAKYMVYGGDKENVIPNTNANGAAWFVKEVVDVNTPSEELKKVGEVDTRSIAVIDNSKFKIIGFEFDSLSSIEMKEFKPAYLKYESQSGVHGLAVFSEIYYPKGWHAFVDGKEVNIVRANYVLRALEIPKGKHVIEFKFEPKPYVVGNKVTMASSWVVLFVMLGCVWWVAKKP
jgi:hypothetical protein